MAQVSKNVSSNKMALNLKSFSEDGLGQFLFFYENCHQSFKSLSRSEAKMVLVWTLPLVSSVNWQNHSLGLEIFMSVKSRGTDQITFQECTSSK